MSASGRCCLAAVALAGTVYMGRSFLGPLATTSSQTRTQSRQATQRMLAGTVAERRTDTVLRTRSRRPRLPDMGEGQFKSVTRPKASDVFEEEIRRDLGLARSGRGGYGSDPNFEPNVGKVIDTLRQDYPLLFFQPLDFSIYSQDIRVRDPTGVVFTGKSTYKRLFAVLRFFKQVLMDNAATSFRIAYDSAARKVRVNWHYTLVLKARRHQPLYISGISVYSLNNEGLVNQHDLETIIVNGTPVEPPFAYAWINLDAWLSPNGPVAVPSPLAGGDMGAFSAVGRDAALGSVLQASAIPMGMPPQGPSKIKVTNPRKKPSDDKNSKRPKSGLSIPWPKVDLPSGCEDSWDCDSPMTCCDFVAFKVCCNQGGLGVQSTPPLIPIPIPVPADNDPPYGAPRGPWDY